MLRKNLPAGLISRLDERTIIEDDDAEERTIVPDVRVVDRGGLESGGLMSGGLISGGLISGGLALLEAPPATEPIVIEIKHEPVTEGFIQVIDTRNGGRIITVIDYTKAPVPILAAGDAEWASTISKTENV